ncbi:ATP-dependent helicase BRM [Platanthera guangdongensis]|uniref:ATP-dependent helicase BRM n=1 Tax=Platanthera guangdongensis TaxID=2320717 RepID=A0ABR2MA39_9ASPA
MLIEQQTGIPENAAQRYTVLSSFLSQIEEYLQNLGNKIMTSKKQHDVEEAAAAAASSQGLSEEEINGAAACSQEEWLAIEVMNFMFLPIGLQWMLSLYNNKLNGILADEMGLGKGLGSSPVHTNWRGSSSRSGLLSLRSNGR